MLQVWTQAKRPDISRRETQGNVSVFYQCLLVCSVILKADDRYAPLHMNRKKSISSVGENSSHTGVWLNLIPSVIPYLVALDE